MARTQNRSDYREWYIEKEQTTTDSYVDYALDSDGDQYVINGMTQYTIKFEETGTTNGFDFQVQVDGHQIKDVDGVSVSGAVAAGAKSHFNCITMGRKITIECKATVGGSQAEAKVSMDGL